MPKFVILYVWPDSHNLILSLKKLVLMSSLPELMGFFFQFSFIGCENKIFQFKIYENKHHSRVEISTCERSGSSSIAECLMIKWTLFLNCVCGGTESWMRNEWMQSLIYCLKGMWCLVVVNACERWIWPYNVSKSKHKIMI